MDDIRRVTTNQTAKFSIMDDSEVTTRTADYNASSYNSDDKASLPQTEDDYAAEDLRGAIERLARKEKAKYAKDKDKADVNSPIIGQYWLYFLVALAFLALFLKGMPGGVMPAEYLPCGFGSNQKRYLMMDGNEVELPASDTARKDLLDNCMNLTMWPTSLQPTSTPESSTEEETERARPRWEGTFTNSSSGSALGSSSAFLFPTAPGITSDAPSASGVASCSKEGQLICNGPYKFGLCSHGRVIWQAVAEGTECNELSTGGGTIVATGISGGTAFMSRPQSIGTSTGNETSLPKSYGNGLGSATAWGPPIFPSTLKTVTRGKWANGTASKNGADYEKAGLYPSGSHNMLYPMGNSSLNITDFSNVTTEQKDFNENKLCPVGNNVTVGQPNGCFRYDYGITYGRDPDTEQAIREGCDYFQHHTLGPEFNQVLVYNFMTPKGNRPRILVKLEYWGNVQGNGIDQRPFDGVCHAFRVGYQQCVDGFAYMLQTDGISPELTGPNRFVKGAYGMDSCTLWTVDPDPDTNNVQIPEKKCGESSYTLIMDPALWNVSSVNTPFMAGYNPTASHFWLVQSYHKWECPATVLTGEEAKVVVPKTTAELDGPEKTGA